MFFRTLLLILTVTIVMTVLSECYSFGDFKRSKRSIRGEQLLIAPKPLIGRQRRHITSEHNRLRRKTNATNMLYMYWDKALAASAQRYANKCTFGHSKGRGDVGENLWAASYANIDRAVRNWYNEVNDRKCRCQNAYKHCCGHYTQVVWAKTNRVGCGMAHCSDLEKIRGRGTRYILVCQYSPAGNVVYVRNGKWFPLPAFHASNRTHPVCSECSGNRDRCYIGLCY